MRHPITRLASLSKGADVLQVCVVGVISHQPGSVQRSTTHGDAVVCNAVIKQGSHEIRCSFWRQHAEALARFAENESVALMQVNVKSKGDYWELFVNEATEIMSCPNDWQQDFLETTSLESTAPRTLLSKRFNVDYATCAANTCTVSAMAAVLQPGCQRALSGVYEMHAIAIMGVAGVQNDDSWQMPSCVECKKKIN